MNTQIIGIIPARYASTRLPGKLLIPILGKSVLQRTFENAKQSQLIHYLAIATDDQKIFDHATEFNAPVFMTSTTCLNGTERLADALKKNPKWLEAKAIVNIQGDEPCLDPAAIDAAITLLMQDPTASMATIATPIKTEEEANSSSVVKCVMDQNNNALYFSRSLIPSNHTHQYNPKTTYYRHIGLYVFRPSFLLHYLSIPSSPLQLEEDLEQLKILEHGFRIKVAITEKPSIGVDLPEDLIKVEQWLCK